MSDRKRRRIGSDKTGYSSMTVSDFLWTYKPLLVDNAKQQLEIMKPWSIVPDIAEALLMPTLMDHFLACDYVVQPPTMDAPLYIQAWAIIKNLLALQAGDADGGRICCVPPGEQQDEELEDSSDEQEEEPDQQEDNEQEEPLARCRSGFTLVRTCVGPLPVRSGFQDLVTKDGATPLLFGEVKAGGSYEVNIGQPLACALELMMMSTAKPESMWVFLATSSMRSWDFVRVDRQPYTAGGAAAAGAAAAPSAAAVADRFSFKRFDPVSAPIGGPSGGYLTLLAALHHILFPGQRLADLPNRVKLSREALEKRAENWITTYQQKLAGIGAAQAEAALKEAEDARAKAEDARAKAEERLKEEVDARAKAEDARAKAEERVEELEALLKGRTRRRS